MRLDLPQLVVTCFYALAAALVSGIHLRSYAENYVSLHGGIDTARMQQAVELSFDLGVAVLAGWFVLTCTTTAMRLWLDPDDRTE